MRTSTNIKRSTVRLSALWCYLAGPKKRAQIDRSWELAKIYFYKERMSGLPDLSQYCQDSQFTRQTVIAIPPGDSFCNGIIPIDTTLIHRLESDHLPMYVVSSDKGPADRMPNPGERQPPKRTIALSPWFVPNVDSILSCRKPSITIDEAAFPVKGKIPPRPHPIPKQHRGPKRPQKHRARKR